MKSKTIIISAVAAVVVIGGLVATHELAEDIAVAPAQLPQQVQAFVSTNFPGQNILYAQKDLDWFTWKYDVFLADGTEINFDTSNEWDKINTQMRAVPTQLIPAPVAATLTANFPAVVVTKIDKESWGYEVELVNGLELKFNKQGAIKEMDD